MVGDKIKNRVAFYQSLLSLLRDSVLTMMAILTVTIFSLGGDPKDMSPFDWAKLVFLAFSIIIFPIISYFIMRWVMVGLSTYGTAVRYITYIDSSIPKGFYSLIALKIFRINKRSYISFWMQRRNTFPSTFGKTNMSLMRYFGKFTVYFDRIVLATYPAFAAVIALTVAEKMFISAVNHYIPISLYGLIATKLSIFINYIQTSLF